MNVEVKVRRTLRKAMLKKRTPLGKIGTRRVSAIINPCEWLHRHRIDSLLEAEAAI